MTAECPWSQDAFLAALAFAAERHGAQMTPGGLPYVTHLSWVAQEVMAALAVEPGLDGTLAVTAAVLHDVIEDTDTTAEMVAERFGQEVAQAVLALSKAPDLPKERRMPDSLNRIRRQPPEVWMVKMADRIANLGPPPGHWTPERIAGYRTEAGTILTALRDASPFLARRLELRLSLYGNNGATVMETRNDGPSWREQALDRVQAKVCELKDRYSSSYYAPERFASPHQSVKLAAEVATDILRNDSTRDLADALAQLAQRRERFATNDVADPDGYVGSTLSSFMDALRAQGPE
jgi:hypothetical protein